MNDSGKRGFGFVIFFILGIILVALFVVAAQAPACPTVPVNVVKNVQEEAWALRIQEKLADHGVAFKIDRAPDYAKHDPNRVVEFVPREKGVVVRSLPTSQPLTSSPRLPLIRPLTPPEHRMIGFVDESGLSVDYKNAWNKAKAGKDVKIKRYGDYFKGKYTGETAYLSDAILGEAKADAVVRADALVDEFNALPFAERQKRVDEFIGRMEGVIQGRSSRATAPQIAAVGQAPFPVAIPPGAAKMGFSHLEEMRRLWDKGEFGEARAYFDDLDPDDLIPGDWEKLDETFRRLQASPDQTLREPLRIEGAPEFEDVEKTLPDIPAFVEPEAVPVKLPAVVPIRLSKHPTTGASYVSSGSDEKILARDNLIAAAGTFGKEETTPLTIHLERETGRLRLFSSFSDPALTAGLKDGDLVSTIYVTRGGLAFLPHPNFIVKNGAFTNFAPSGLAKELLDPKITKYNKQWYAASRAAQDALPLKVSRNKQTGKTFVSSGPFDQVFTPQNLLASSIPYGEDDLYSVLVHVDTPGILRMVDPSDARLEKLDVHDGDFFVPILIDTQGKIIGGHVPQLVRNGKLSDEVVGQGILTALYNRQVIEYTDHYFPKPVSAPKKVPSPSPVFVAKKTDAPFIPPAPVPEDQLARMIDISQFPDFPVKIPPGAAKTGEKHLIALEELVQQNNFAGAQRYLAKHRSELIPDDAAKIDEFLQKNRLIHPTKIRDLEAWLGTPAGQSFLATPEGAGWYDTHKQNWLLSLFQLGTLKKSTLETPDAFPAAFIGRSKYAPKPGRELDVNRQSGAVFISAGDPEEMFTPENLRAASVETNGLPGVTFIIDGKEGKKIRIVPYGSSKLPYEGDIQTGVLLDEAGGMLSSLSSRIRGGKLDKDEPFPERLLTELNKQVAAYKKKYFSQESFDYDSLQVMNILKISPETAQARDVRRIGAAYKAEVGLLDAGEHTPLLSKLVEEGVLTEQEYIQLRKGAPMVMGGEVEEDLRKAVDGVLTQIRKKDAEEALITLRKKRDILPADEFKKIEADLEAHVLDTGSQTDDALLARLNSNPEITGDLETIAAKLSAKGGSELRTDILPLIREQGPLRPPYEGFISNTVLEDNRRAYKNLREQMVKSDPDVVFVMERGGVFIGETIARGTGLESKLVSLSNIPDPRGRLKFDPDTIAALVQKQIDDLKRGGMGKPITVAFTDSFMGGRFSSELKNRVIKKLLTKKENANVNFEVYFLRETFGFFDVTNEGFVLKILDESLPFPSDSPYASRYRVYVSHTPFILGEDVGVFFEASSKPLYIFNDQGEVVRIIRPETTSRDTLIQLLSEPS